ncbi:MAG TPA: sugar kinase [Anaerolineales bacterium]|nr:sugar kinase [Anaerolineales bacterium]
MTDVVTFGECMLRLSPPDFQRLEQATQLNMAVGGSELNVAAGVARLGLSAAWVSRLPDNPLGRMVRNKAREMGVDTSHLLWTKDDRLGVYFVEYGASPRASSVLYDRSHSAISKIQPGEVAWDEVFQGCRLFHVSGITPALSDSAAAVTAEAIGAAKAAGAQISYDLNYRAKLWTQEKARRVQSPFMADVDILMTTEEDTERVFGITGGDYREVAKALADQFELRVVVITLRGTPSVWRNTWSALAYSQGTYYDDVTYEVEVVDRVGSGDTFSAGFLYGYLTKDIPRGLKVGNAFAALKHSSWSDFNWSTLEETEALIRGSGLRIVR